MKQPTYDPAAAVRGFLADRFGVAPAGVAASASLQYDFGLDGADAIEFFDAFGERFGVDLSELDFHRHFGPEAPFNPLSWLYLAAVRKLKPGTARRLVPITVQSLIEAARCGKWVGGQRR